MGRPLRETLRSITYKPSVHTHSLHKIRPLAMGTHCPVVSLAVCSGNGLVSSSLVVAVVPGERPLLSSASFWRLKRFVVSADHCETPALPLALTRTNKRHTRYPSTIAVEIQADNAVRRTMSKLKIVPNRATSNHASESACGVTHRKAQ